MPSCSNGSQMDFRAHVCPPSNPHFPIQIAGIWLTSFGVWRRSKSHRNVLNMIKSRLLYQVWIFAMLTCSCSVDVSMTPHVEQTPLIPSTSVFPATQIPVTWAHLNLTGRLVYLTSTMEG